ncbi:hypothetical protein [Staphylococcus pettenkoferi]|uniref:hypothetical protein n=1 Tax=Staphylococcus pettenkoferi TaxID=170573 RepID=UPI0011A2FE1B|nr:hypothetical protein [Staphylococcus pettenkoferi]
MNWKKSQIQQTHLFGNKQAISEIQSIVNEYSTKLNDETQEKINEVNEASDKVLESIKQNNVVTTEETENWQKYKLTEDDGTIKYYSKGTIEDVTQLPAGLYETVSDDDATDQGIPLDNSYVQIKVWEAGRGRKEIELTSTFNSEKYFRLIHTDGTKDSGWQKIGNNQSDTGWLPLRLKNGYKKSSTPDFEPSYRVIDNGDFKQVYVRLGVENLANEKNVVATIPSEFVPNKIYSLGVSTTYKTPPKVIISGGDIEFHPYNGDSYNSTDYIIYQDNWII